MSEPSSSAAEWSSHLEPPRIAERIFQRSDDPRLGDVMTAWRGDVSALVPGRIVLVGFPQDEGVRRNSGRPGAAQAPVEIRRMLGKLVPVGSGSPLDAGNVRIAGTLEDTQRALGEVVAGLLGHGTVPIVLGGGHETTYGMYQGYVLSQKATAIVNIDAHLDVRQTIDGRGTSGTPFRQALEHPTAPLPGPRYVVLGMQHHATSVQHLEYARSKGCIVHDRDECEGELLLRFSRELKRLSDEGCSVHVTVDGDAVDASSVPGVSAPNADGLSARDVLLCVRLAGESPAVSSLDVVEINPTFDRDGRSSRWAALVVWNFLAGRRVVPSSEPVGSALHREPTTVTM